MTKFQKGDRVVILHSFHSNCVSKLTTVVGPSAYSSTYVLDPCGQYRDHLSVSNNCLKLATRDLDHLQPGDILVDDEGDDREVYAVEGKLAAVSDGFNDGEYDFSWIHVEKLKSRDYTLKGQPADAVELTLDDIAKLKGVPVDQIKIVEK